MAAAKAKIALLSMFINEIIQKTIFENSPNMKFMTEFSAGLANVRKILTRGRFPSSVLVLMDFPLAEGGFTKRCSSIIYSEIDSSETTGKH